MVSCVYGLAFEIIVVVVGMVVVVWFVCLFDIWMEWVRRLLVKRLFCLVCNDGSRILFGLSFDESYC